MKKLFILIISLALVVTASAKEADCEYLAKVTAKEMKDEPFIVKVAFCEMLINRLDSEFFPSTLPAVAHTLGLSRAKVAAESDIYAASIALERFVFFEDVFYCKRWNEVKNTPLENAGGVRLYDWYFYSASSM